MSAWKSLYRCALSVFALVAALTPIQAIANPVSSSVEASGEMSLSTANHPVLRQVGTLTEEQGTIQTVGELVQVTSVSQLSDVRPTDWAFTALQSLVERYGCIAGYQERMFQPPAMPSAPIRGLGQKTLAQGGTVSVFRGQRSLTRFEFAAGVNACLNRMNELLTAGLADKVGKEDLATLQRLQEEFEAELGILKVRVDTLEGKVEKLEGQQFSTTTKLEGEAIFAVSVSGGGDNPVFGSNLVRGNGLTGTRINDESNLNTTFTSRVRLSFNTSLTGSDLLVTRLDAGSGGDFLGGVLGANPNGNLGNVGFGTYGLDYSGLGTNIALGTLRYDFNLAPNFRVSVGPSIVVSAHVDANSFANNESADFSSTFFINNPLVILLNQFGQGGAAFDWNPGGGAFSLRGVYVAARASSATRQTNAPLNPINTGFAGDPYQGTVELEFAPKRADGEPGPFALRLQYTNASINNLDYNTGGVNLEWALSKGFALFGRYGFGSIDGRSGQLANNPAMNNFINRDATGSTLNPQTWMFGLAFPDLFKPGALAAIAVGQPFIESKVGNTSQTNLELFYRLPLTDNITITPDLQFVFNPNNNSANDTIVIGTIRTVFTF